MPGVSRGFNFLGMLNNCRPLALKMFLVVNSVNCIQIHQSLRLTDHLLILFPGGCPLNNGDKHP